ncbi:hypothetical protein ACLDW2_19415, partial [Acinetobacter baumannii]
VGKSGKNALGKEAYQAKDCAPVMQIGSIWVKPSAPVIDINAKVKLKQREFRQSLTPRKFQMSVKSSWKNN